MEYKKAPDLAAQRGLGDQTRGRSSHRKLGATQARMNKQYSGQSWRMPRPGLADASKRDLGMQSVAFKTALCDH